MYPLATLCDPYLNLFRGIIPPIGVTVLNVFTNTAAALPCEMNEDGTVKAPEPKRSPGAMLRERFAKQRAARAEKDALTPEGITSGTEAVEKKVATKDAADADVEAAGDLVSGMAPREAPTNGQASRTRPRQAEKEARTSHVVVGLVGEIQVDRPQAEKLRPRMRPQQPRPKKQVRVLRDPQHPVRQLPP